MAEPAVARGSVLLTPKFDNLTGTIGKQLGGAFGGASAIASKSGKGAGKAFGAGIGAVAGGVAGVVGTIASRALDAVTSSIGLSLIHI